MMDADHFRNWIAAMRSRKPGDLLAEIEEGHRSSALAHLANIAYRTGRTLTLRWEDGTFRRRQRRPTSCSPVPIGRRTWCRTRFRSRFTNPLSPRAGEGPGVRKIRAVSCASHALTLALSRRERGPRQGFFPPEPFGSSLCAAAGVLSWASMTS